MVQCFCFFLILTEGTFFLLIFKQSEYYWMRYVQNWQLFFSKFLKLFKINLEKVFSFDGLKQLCNFVHLLCRNLARESFKTGFTFTLALAKKEPLDWTFFHQIGRHCRNGLKPARSRRDPGSSSPGKLEIKNETFLSRIKIEIQYQAPPTQLGPQK